MPVKQKKINLFKGTMQLINLLVAFALILSLLPAYIPPSAYPVFSIFGLIYPSLLLFNLAFVVLWLVLRNRFIWVSVIVISLGIFNLLNNFQFSGGSSKDIDSSSLKVLSYNVQLFGLTDDQMVMEINKDSILEFIKKEDPNITCLQEYYSEGRTRYEPLENIKTGLHAGAHYFESYFNPRHNQLTGLVIFSKYPAVGKGKLKFDGSRTFGIYTDLLVNNDTIRVYNIHLASIQLMPEDIDFVVRANQNDQKNFFSRASRILAKLNDAFLLREKQMDYLDSQLSICDYPVVLCGDFNDTPSSYVYNKITTKLEDTFKEKGSGLGITYAGQIPMLRIDYVLKSKYFQTLAYKRHRINYSDHYPVSAVIDIMR